MAGMTLEQFWDSTPYEITLIMGGFSERVSRWYEVAAFVSAYVINIWSKRKVTPKQLLPRKRGVVDVRQFSSKAELDAYLDKHRIGDT